MQEAVTALYTEAEFGLLRNRLKVLTGVRYERTETEGEGPSFDPNAVWVRDASGSFAHNAAGARIRRTEAGAAGSIEELRLTRSERASRGEQSHHGYYPSLHLTFNVRENLLVRAAYAKTYGRPNFGNVIPNSTINEADLDDAVPDLFPGTINVRNTGLRLWRGVNYDLSVEYYTKDGGLLSAGLFRKDITDFFGEVTRVSSANDIEQLGLDPRYTGWQLTTRYNLTGSARVTGGEFNIRQPLRPLGEWGRRFAVFVNGTKMDLDGNRDADFYRLHPRKRELGRYVHAEAIFCNGEVELSR